MDPSSPNNLVFVSLSHKLNLNRWLFRSLKWRLIKEDLRDNFFSDLLLHYPKIGLLYDNGVRPFIFVHRLANDIEKLLARMDICDAEDLLFVMFDKYPSFDFLPFCKYFYQRLSSFSDKDLISANFSRKEIEEGLRYVEKRFG